MRALVLGFLAVMCWATIATCDVLDIVVEAINRDMKTVPSCGSVSGFPVEIRRTEETVWTVPEGASPAIAGVTLVLREPAAPERFKPGIGLGAGPIHAWSSSPLRAFDDASGWGLQITMETHLADQVVWDLRLGGFYTSLEEPEEICYPADDGDWSILSTALHIDVRRAGNATFWVGPEGSLHYAQMKHYDYVGSGLGIGPVFGVDFASRNERVVTRFGGHTSWVWLESDSADPSRPSFVAAVSMDVLFRFRRG